MATVRHLGLFPFCVQELDELPPQANQEIGSLYPVGVTLETAMSWYWRVKTWKLLLRIDTESVQTTFAAGGFMDNSVQISQPNNEKDFVCKKGTQVQNYDGGFDQYEVNLYDVANPAPDGVLIKVGELYYPQFQFQCNVQGSVFASYRLEDNGVIGGSASIDGIEFPAYLSPADFPPENCNFSMTPEEYWPYDPE